MEVQLQRKNAYVTDYGDGCAAVRAIGRQLWQY